MTAAKLGKVAGWLLVIGPLVDLLVSLTRPGSFPGDHPGGPQGSLQEAVRSTADAGSLVQFMIDVRFVAAFGLLLGFWGVARIMKGDGRGHLRQMGMLFLTVALAVRAASFGMGLLLSTTVNFSPSSAFDSGDTLDTAVMFLVMEGALAVAGVILTLVGVAFFAVSMTTANLVGSDRVLAVWLGIAPAVVGVIALLLAPYTEDGIFVLYAIGNLVVVVQILWAVLVGAALIRKNESLPAL